MVLCSRYKLVQRLIPTKWPFPYFLDTAVKQQLSEFECLNYDGPPVGFPYSTRSSRTSTESSRCVLDHELTRSGQYWILGSLKCRATQSTECMAFPLPIGDGPNEGYRIYPGYSLTFSTLRHSTHSSVFTEPPLLGPALAELRVREAMA